MDLSSEISNSLDNLTSEKIFELFFKIGKEGDVVILKNDGLRKETQFTVVITSSRESFESIRVDEGDLYVAFKNALINYARQINKPLSD